MKGLRKIIIIHIGLFILTGLFCLALPNYCFTPVSADDNDIDKTDLIRIKWVDSVFNSMDLEERIAQLLMIRVYSNKDNKYYKEIEDIITNYKIGGIAFFKGGPVAQAKLTNRYQNISKTPMLIGMDAEWGLSMRLDSVVEYPRQMTLGAIPNEMLVYEFGFEVARQLKRIGCHINFAPVVDVNNNPANPVINNRSFGECRYNVTRKSMAYMKGLQDGGVIANAKHFPGHGDTDADSHHTLPIIKHSKEIMDSIHLFPFKHLIDNGLLSIMVAHLEIPAYEPTPKLASTLSYPIVTELLKDQLGFQGLIITDALDMKGVSDYYKPGELEVKALQAGNDILLLPHDVPVAIEAIKNAVEKKKIKEEVINQKCYKVLFFKYMMGLNNYKSLDTLNIINDLQSRGARNLNRRLIEASMTLVKNENQIIPIKRPDTLKIAALAIGGNSGNPFHSVLSNYADVDFFSISKEPTKVQIDKLLDELKAYNLVIASFHNNSYLPKRNYGITDQSVELINLIGKQKPIILSLFANPYALSYFKNSKNIKAIIVAYQEGKLYEETTAQIIFGALPAKGKLPVSVSPYFHVYSSEQTQGSLRIKFGYPEDVGLNPIYLSRIDTIVVDAIKKKAFPGCQIAIIKNGTMIYQKSFGFHVYDNKTHVSNSDIYDLASLTKILSTTIAIMQLYDQGKINLNKNLGSYLSALDSTNKADLLICDILAHQARLKAWIPFYISTLENFKPNPLYYHSEPSEEYPLRVAENLYIHRSFSDSIFKRIIASPLLSKKSYLYSDMGFILFAEMIHQISGIRINEFVENNIYSRMGLSKLCYLPRQRFPLDRIVPSENDTNFRKQILHGDVNDPAAAMLGGISGHAGLFGNAGDVATLMYMLINDGKYAGNTFINSQTIKLFTSQAFPSNNNRRGLGFDRPTQLKGPSNPAADGASLSSFGHSGFTGTYAWADPEHDLVFVFLSNRTFPYASNRIINQLSTRQKCHQVIYDAINHARYISISRNK